MLTRSSVLIATDRAESASRASGVTGRAAVCAPSASRPSALSSALTRAFKRSSSAAGMKVDRQPSLGKRAYFRTSRIRQSGPALSLVVRSEHLISDSAD